jgi:hypothetical protein
VVPVIDHLQALQALKPVFSLYSARTSVDGLVNISELDILKSHVISVASARIRFNPPEDWKLVYLTILNCIRNSRILIIRPAALLLCARWIFSNDTLST